MKILKYLYSKKNDGKFYDVSLCLKVFNPYKYENIEIGFHEIELDSNISRFIKRIGRKLLNNKNDIDRFVISLERNGYVTKKVEGYLSMSALTTEDDPTDANNSICMITPKGIEYYENYNHNRKTRNISSIALLISLIAVASSIISLFFQNFKCLILLCCRAFVK